MKYLELVINSGLLDQINKKGYITAFEQLKITAREFNKNEAIILEGDEVDRICIIDKGSVRSEKVYPNGEAHIVGIYEEGSIFGLEFAVSKKRLAAVDFICNEKSTVVFITMSSIEGNEYSDGLHKSLTYMLADSNIRTAHKVEILAEKGLRRRIMVYLSVLQSKSGSNTVTLNMNREQLAQYLCVNRSALSSELSKMRSEKIIEVNGSKITIL